MSLARRILALAWPVLIGQAASMLSGTIDTIVTGHASADDLAAMAVGGAIYSSVYVGLMGVLMALNPIVANRVGAKDFEAAGQSFVEGLWLAVLLTGVGAVLIGYPALWVHLSHASPAVGEKISAYLHALLFALPAAMVFRTVYAFSTAVGRPRAIMIINLIGLAIKLPLDIGLVYGDFGLPKMGAPGCAVATAVVMWTSCSIGLSYLFKSPLYRLYRFRPAWPKWHRFRELVALGVPTGMSYIVEVSAFTGMAVLAARLGSEVTSGHQIAANLCALCYMVPLSLSVATATLVAQSLGAKDATLAVLTFRMGLRIALIGGLVVGATIFLGRPVLANIYTSNKAAAAIGSTLLCFVSLFVVFDAMQSIASFTLRAYRRTVAPMVIDGLALWGVGLLGGYLLAFHAVLGHPPFGVYGLWIAATASIILVAAIFNWYANLIVVRVQNHPALIPALGEEAPARAGPARRRRLEGPQLPRRAVR